MIHQLKRHKHLEHQRGQIALISLLLMVVVLTVGISLATRSTLDVAITRQEEQGSMTFQAAESGIEEALSSDYFDDAGGSGSADVTGATITYDITPTETGPGNYYLETTFPIAKGGVVEVPVVGGASKELNVYFEKTEDACNSGSDPDSPSLLMTHFSTSPNKAYHYGYACNSGAGGFSTSADSIIGNYKRKITQPIDSTISLVRIKVLNKATHIKVDGNAINQAVQWDVVSKAENDSGDETKAIQVSRTYPIAPSILDYAMYSGVDITK